MKNPLLSLQDQGQSVWLDYLRRSLITGGGLKRLIDEDGLRGLTSNPSIFEKAIAESGEYRDMLEAPESQGIDAKTLYERIAVRDVQEAADILCPVFMRTDRCDGYASFEVSPQLAHTTQGTLEEARRLWLAAGRENLMIKVPGTPEGIPAIRQLIGEGINVNVTLLFARETYEQAAQAYLDGLETLAGRGGDLAKVTSVASFFVSRIDTAVDQYIGERVKDSQNPGENAVLLSLLGKVAVASANNTYQKYLEIHREDRWRDLKKKGAHSQRLLWASTGAKNPHYSDVLYVEELVGHDTVNTMPPATLEAFRDHGHVRPALIENVQESIRILDLVKQAGIPLKELTDKLLVEGVRQFADAFDKLLKSIEHSGNATDHDPITFLRIKLLKELDKERHSL